MKSTGVKKAAFFILIFQLVATVDLFSQSSIKANISPAITRLEYDQFLFIGNGVIGVKKGDKYALVNTKGEFIVPWGKYIFDHADNEVNSFGLIKVKNAVPFNVETDQYRVGYINLKGELVVPLVYSARGIAKFDQFGIGYVSEIVKTPSTNILKEQMPYITKPVRIDLKGKKIPYLNGDKPLFKIQHGWIGTVAYTPDTNRIAVTDINNKTVFIDLKGKITVPAVDNKIYHSRNPYSEGLSVTSKIDEFGKEKWGYLNSEGKEPFPFLFSKEPGPFRDGLALVEPAKKDEFGFAFIDRLGAIKFTIPTNLEPKAIEPSGEKKPASAGYFINGYSYWQDKNRRSLILYNPNGIFINFNDFIQNKEPGVDKYDLGAIKNNKLIIIATSGAVSRTGICNSRGTIIVPPLFSYITPDYHAEYYYATIITEDGKTRTEGIVDAHGTFILLKADAPVW